MLESQSEDNTNLDGSDWESFVYSFPIEGTTLGGLSTLATWESSPTHTHLKTAVS